MSDTRASYIDPSQLRGQRDLVQYKVKSGDTLKSLADRVGTTWQHLAILNWGTCEPNEINWYLEHFVGCTRTAGVNFVFTTADVPGVIWLPKRVSARSKRVRRAVLHVSRYAVEEG